MPYNDEIEQTIVGDFKRLWATNFLDDLSIEVRDVRFANGVIGKVVVYNMEERQRVKIVDYVGTEEGRPVEDRRGAEERSSCRSGSTRSSIRACIRRVAGVVREVYAEKGYQFAEVKPEVKADRGRAEAGERHLPHHRRAEGQDPRGRVRRQQGDQRRQAAPAR